MRSFVIALFVLTGCDMYFSGGDDECKAVPQTGAFSPAVTLRNPQTGVCEQQYQPPYCDDRCGPCPEYDQALAMPDWGSCVSACEGLEEGKCKTTSGCFAAYTDYPTQDRAPEFRGCWQTAPSGPISEGVCKG